MKTVLITGANGFIGKNLHAALNRRENIKVLAFDIEDDLDVLTRYLENADIVYHLAGVNRPEQVKDFDSGNTGFTNTIIKTLNKLGKFPSIVLSSSVQAILDNPYGKSKKNAEDLIIDYDKKSGGNGYIFRLPGVYGKWCRPNYNSVVATFCYNISHGLDITISDEKYELELVYIDDVVKEFIALIDVDQRENESLFCEVPRKFRVTLGELAEKIFQLRDARSSLIVPDLTDDFMKCLNATYISYLDKDKFSYPLEMKTDNRGWLAELIKSDGFGQIFVSSTHEGVIRGNHYHDTKVEKFCVIKGEAVVKFRHILNGEILSYNVSDDKIEVVDIPPGYTHSIENLGKEEMIVIFWANQIFDSSNPDTYYLEV